MASRTFRHASLFVFTVFVGVFFFTVPGTGSAFRNVKEGADGVAFNLKDAEGKAVDFKPASGKVTVLSFVKLSQDRSMDQMKDLAAMYDQLNAKGIEFLAITAYNDNVDEMKKTVSDLKLKFPVVIDAEQKVYGDYGLYILPSTAIIGKDGKLVFESAGHGRDYKDLVGGKMKVLAGLMTEEEYKKLNTPVESVEKSREEKEAEKEVNLGKTLIKRGMVDKAGAAFAKAVSHDPKNVVARVAYGESLVAAKQFDNAFLQFEEARKLAPANKEVQLGLGILHLEKGALDNAIKVIGEAATLNPHPEKAWYWLGAAYEKKGDLPNAVKYYRKAVEKFIKE